MIKQRFGLNFLFTFALSTMAYAQESNQQALELNQKIYGGASSAQQSVQLQLEDKKDKKGRASINWIGFEMKSNGGSRIFIKTSAPIEFHELSTSLPNTFAIEFDKTKLITRNDQRDIDTSYFYAVVQSVKAIQKDGNTVNLLIKLREECEPKMLADGNLIYIDFPAPQRVPDVYQEAEDEKSGINQLNQPNP